jgi:hypothetical protein
MGMFTALQETASPTSYHDTATVQDTFACGVYLNLQLVMIPLNSWDLDLKYTSAFAFLCLLIAHFFTIVRSMQTYKIISPMPCASLHPHGVPLVCHHGRRRRTHIYRIKLFLTIEN